MMKRWCIFPRFGERLKGGAGRTEFGGAWGGEMELRACVRAQEWVVHVCVGVGVGVGVGE